MAAALKANRDRFRRGSRPGRNWRPAALSGGSAMRCGQGKPGSGVQVRETGGWAGFWLGFLTQYFLSDVLLGPGVRACNSGRSRKSRQGVTLNGR